MDLRTQKTYDALLQAFRDLLKEKAFEEITVQELCARARVRRATFYNHFADKYAFLDFVIQTIRSKRTAVIKEQTGDEGPVVFFTSLLSTILTFLEENGPTVKSFRMSNIAFLAASLGPEDLSQQIRENLERYQEAGYLMVGDPEILAEFLLGAIGQVSRWWLEQDGRVSVEEALARLEPILESVFPD